jgi:UPF0271 protein
MKKKVAIDFNADVGESFASYRMGLDEEIVKHITSANIACGFHAGDPDWMARTVALAEAYNVGIGAHPAYPDLPGFGRRDMSLTPDEVANAITYQVGALTAFTKSKKLKHVKPHGALYNRAVGDADIAAAIVNAIKKIDEDMIHVVLANSVWEDVAREENVRVARECYADRAVTPSGTLVPRSQPGSVINDKDEVTVRSLRLAMEGKVTASDGKDIDFSADTICLHGDTPGAVEMAASVRSRFEANGIEVKTLSQIID